MDFLPFKATDWYFKRDSGAVYCTARGVELSAEEAAQDEEYQSWLVCTGGWVPQYPAVDGVESRESLVGMLRPDGVRVYPLSLAEVRADVVTAINAAFESACAALLADEPPSATATYATQQAEAEAFARNSATPTPMLDMLAAARGIDKAELVRRVLAKAELYAQASGLLLGQQQRLMDDIAAIMGTPDLSDDLKIVALEQLDIRISLPTGGEG